jgi:hypothetical protein
MKTLRPIKEPFVVAPPSGARVRTRLRLDVTDTAVLQAVGEHLGSLAGSDLAKRCALGKADGKARADSRRRRKRALTSSSSSRWAGAITRTSEDAWQLAYRNLSSERRSIKRRVGRIRSRLAIPVGAREGKVRGYATPAELFQKRRLLQVLESRLHALEQRITDGRVTICRGTKRLAKLRHNLDAAGLSESEWRKRWEASRLFITADGEASQLLGNLTIRWSPTGQWLELRLPGALDHLANCRASRKESYRLRRVWCREPSHRTGDPEGRWAAAIATKDPPWQAGTLRERGD